MVTFDDLLIVANFFRKIYTFQIVSQCRFFCNIQNQEIQIVITLHYSSKASPFSDICSLVVLVYFCLVRGIYSRICVVSLFLLLSGCFCFLLFLFFILPDHSNHICARSTIPHINEQIKFVAPFFLSFDH